MNHEIAKSLKEARIAKGLSQRALADIAGVPQGHISKIENAGVDLRLSSLTEIARALDLELALVPRKTVPAVKSIVRSAQPLPGYRANKEVQRALGSIENAADRIAKFHTSKEAVQLQSRIHDLTRLKIPSSYLESIKEISIRLNQTLKGKNDPESLHSILDSVQQIRNQLAHSQTEQLGKATRSIYELGNDNG